MTQGIYTLANDVVYDQLVALLNSIEVNIGADFPVCIVAYDGRLDKVRSEIKNRKNVELLEERSLYIPWEKFAEEIWQTHPTAFQDWQNRGVKGINRLGMHYRFLGFDERAPFKQFIYLDADILILKSLETIFNQLTDNDIVVYDFQYKDPSHVYDVNSPRLKEVFSEAQLKSDMFCAGMYASHRGLFPQEQREWLITQLQEGDGEILYPSGPDQSILNYMAMKTGSKVNNLSLHIPPEEKTGCCVTSPHFQRQGDLLYDKGVQLTYLHYIGVSSSAFTRLCAGENLDIPYRELFLDYRYLYEPENKPHFTGKPKLVNPPPSFSTKVLKKLGLKK